LNPESRTITTLDVLGIKITPMTLTQVIELFGAHIASGRPCLMSSMNFHGLYVYSKDASFRELNRRSLVHIDGVPVVWLARLLGHPVRRRHRVAWLDLIGPLLETAEKCDWRVYYLGGAPNIVRDGIAEIRRKYPTITIDGHHGYFARTCYPEVRDRIRTFAPDILIVGMGMSVQERWILENAEQLEVPVIATAGACIEYIARAAKIPPRWLGLYGLEWLYRLASNPKRFWRRYLLEPWAVLAFLAGRVLSARRSIPHVE
jgi:N-acetylglucosaminyldiphosphoundecaprenol N-acetyl-beta-D-mannosaminyltransferase